MNLLSIRPHGVEGKSLLPLISGQVYDAHDKHSAVMAAKVNDPSIKHDYAYSQTPYRGSFILRLRNYDLSGPIVGSI